MHSITVSFTYLTLTEDGFSAINHLINQWRNNGQIIGREISLLVNDDVIKANVITPEADSLFDDYNSAEVNQALSLLEQHDLSFKEFDLNGADYNSDLTSDAFEHEFQILYTTHLDSCSPLRSSEDLGAIPLYTLKNQALSEKILKWQEDWQACDQLQMNGNVLEKEALFQISEYTSDLAKRGLALCAEIEKITDIPTYYYLYRLGDDEAVENSRECPACAKGWKLIEPLHDIFYFKCDENRLISNLSWEIEQ